MTHFMKGADLPQVANEGAIQIWTCSLVCFVQNARKEAVAPTVPPIIRQLKHKHCTSAVQLRCSVHAPELPSKSYSVQVGELNTFKIQFLIIERSLEVKLLTIWTDEKKRREESEGREGRREKIGEDKESEERSSDARKGRKVAKHCVFPMICGSGRSKSRLAKAAGAEPSGQMRDEKVHAVVARSTCRSENVQTTPCPDHF